MSFFQNLFSFRKPLLDQARQEMEPDEFSDDEIRRVIRNAPGASGRSIVWQLRAARKKAQQQR